MNKKYSLRDAVDLIKRFRCGCGIQVFACNNSKTNISRNW